MKSKNIYFDPRIGMHPIPKISKNCPENRNFFRNFRFSGQNRFQMKEHLILCGKLVLQAKIDLFSPEQFTFKVFEIERVILWWFFWPLKNQFFWIFETLIGHSSGLSRPILAYFSIFPLKIKFSFIWKRFWPGKIQSGNIPAKIRFFGFLKFSLLGTSDKRGKIIYF